MNSQENQVEADDALGAADTPPEAQADADNDAPSAEADALQAAQQELEAARAQATENWERCLRTAAELDNVRKRAARDVENAHKFGLEKFVRELLGVRDNLERGLDAAPEDEALQAFVDGVDMTLKSFDQVLEKFGVELIDPLGEAFDPERHEALAARPAEDAESGTVVEVMQKGFALNGRLLRAARVFVAQ